MNRICFLLVLILVTSCQYASRQPKALTDTIEKLSRQADYKPLDTNEVYNFLNKYYLPHLDSLHYKRNIYIHPINGRDFKAIFQRDKSDLEAEFYQDTAHLKVDKIRLIAPDPVLFNEDFCWDGKRLRGTIIITGDGMVRISQNDVIKDIEAWHKKYGSGYMCISYPQYNANTKRLFIREWFEDHSLCATGRASEYSFTRSANGWTALNYLFYSKVRP